MGSGTVWHRDEAEIHTVTVAIASTDVGAGRLG